MIIASILVAKLCVSVQGYSTAGPQDGGYFDSFDSLPLYFKQWPVPGNVTIIGRIIAVHGLNEHINRYDALFTSIQLPLTASVR
jgi:hypothetical protein